MPKMLSAKNTKLTFVTTLANWNIPTAAEANAGLHLELLVSAKNFSLGASDQEEISDPPIASMSNASTGGRVKYDGTADFFRYTTTAEDKAWLAFTDTGLSGFLIKRIGVPYTQTYAAGDKVLVYEIITGLPMVLTPDNDVTGYEKFRQRFFVQERVNERASIGT